jgi:NADPH-dependent 2,4-dienoyl-CoA reductase/sulfur reductase-like enzyme/rhodanese-related sulfurtransferase
MRILVIGGVATGMSAATRLRRLDEQAELVVYEKSGNVSYANCGLPYYLGGVIENREELLLQTPKSLKARFNIDVHINSEVTNIDLAAKTVTVRNTATLIEHQDSYDKLIISTGARPKALEVPGGEQAIPLRTVEDMEHIKSVMDGCEEKTAVVVGSGFIGIEVTENLHSAGFTVHLINNSNQIMSPFDSEISELMRKALTDNGVLLHLGTNVREVRENSVELTNGITISASLVINATGITPETTLAKEAGLTIGDTGGIWVDEQHLTSDPSVYAGGDVAQKHNLLTDSYSLIPLANLANRHGRAIADSIYEIPVTTSRSLGTSIIGAFGMMLAMTGLSEKAAVKQGIAHSILHVHPSDHAGYYPGAVAMSMKVLFNPETGLILGAQASGQSGIDKRIDVIATAIKGNLTINDLMDLELTYAPQFGSAKDAINQVGYVGNNILSGKTRTVQWHEVSALKNSGYMLVDVRTPAEHSNGHIPDSINLELNNLRNHINELQGKKVIVYCQVGQRGHTSSALLQGYGIDVLNLDGGYKTWRIAMDSIEK